VRTQVTVLLPSSSTVSQKPSDSTCCPASSRRKTVFVSTAWIVSFLRIGSRRARRRPSAQKRRRTSSTVRRSCRNQRLFATIFRLSSKQSTLVRLPNVVKASLSHDSRLTTKATSMGPSSRNLQFRTRTCHRPHSARGVKPTTVW
jgi:hypothetical protein